MTVTRTTVVSLECDLCPNRDHIIGFTFEEVWERHARHGWRGLPAHADTVLDNPGAAESSRRHACPKCSGAREEGAT